MGPVYDQPRETLSKEQVDASLRYQIMEIVDGIRWYPSFGYDREIDWLLNMHDWMISKKRYYGLALPIFDCASCGTFEVVGGREQLRERAIAGWDAFEGHTPHRPHVDAVRIACSGCGKPVARIPDVGNPWLDAGIVPFSTLHYREDADYWAKWFPADFVTESFPHGEIKAVANGIFQDLSVEKLGNLPERDLKMEAGAPNTFEHAHTPIVDAGHVSRRNGDEKTANDFVDKEGNN